MAEPSPRIIRWTPSLMSLLLGVLFAWALFLPLLSGDLGWHIRSGQYVLSQHEIPRTHFFCWTVPWHPWVSHEWLSGVLFAGVDGLAGLPGLLLLRALLFVTTLGLLYRLGRRLEAEPLALAGLTLLAAIALALHVSLRPWLFSNLLLVLCLHLSHQARLSNQPTPAYLALTAILGLWINLHGGFVVGVGLFGLLLLERWRGRRLSGNARPSRTARSRFNRLRARLLGGLPGGIRGGVPGGLPGGLVGGLLYGLLLLGVLLLNPHGLEALALPFRYLLGEDSSGLALTSEIKEWAPLELGSFFGRIYLIWLGLGLWSLVRSRSARRRPEALLAMAFSLLTLNAQRHLPLMALFWYPVVAEGLLFPLALRLDRTLHPRLRFVRGLSHREAPSRLPFLVLLMTLITLGYASSAREPDFEASRCQSKGYPLQAVQVLRTLPPGRLFNHYDWGGFIVWKAPEWSLFISPVNDAYPRALFEDWLTIANRQTGWEKRLEVWKVDTVLMPSSALLAQTLMTDARWRVLYQDTNAMLLQKHSAAASLPSTPTPSAPPH